MDDTEDEERRKAAARAYARQALGDAKADGPREPEPREHKPHPDVDRLRHLAAPTQADPAATPEETTP
jgi:hypothetical protein